MSLLKKNMIKISLISLLSASLSLSSVAQNSNTYLMVRNYPDMMPITFLDESSQPIGFEQELLDEIIKRIDVTVDVEFATGFTPAMEKVQEGSADMVMATVSITEARKPYYDFSKPYFIANPVAILSKDDTLKSATDLVDKKVGVMSKSTHEMRIREIKGNESDDDTIETFDSIFLAIKALMQDKVDAVVGDDSYLYDYAERYGDDGLVINIDDSYPKDRYAIAFKKGASTELKNKIDKAIIEIISDGTYDKILNKWYPSLNNELKR